MAARKRSPKGFFVVDCSVTMAWFFEDEGGPYADAVQETMARNSSRGVVPALWRLEVANTLVVGERRKRTTEAKSHRFLTLLSLLPIQIDTATTASMWESTIQIARGHGLSAYDAAYLELAVRRGLPLATLDAKLKNAALSAGVEIFEPK